MVVIVAIGFTWPSLIDDLRFYFSLYGIEPSYVLKERFVTPEFFKFYLVTSDAFLNKFALKSVLDFWPSISAYDKSSSESISMTFFPWDASLNFK